MTTGLCPVRSVAIAGSDPSPIEGRAEQKGASSPHIWVSTTYFAEGFPYSVVHTLAEVLFTELKASLQIIGLTSLFHLPWNLKFLWGPYLDEYGTKRRWIALTEIVVVACLLGLAVAAEMGASGLVAASALFMLLAFFSATHDVAIDGYYLEALDERQQSRFVGFRAPAYRVAMLVVAGPSLILIQRVGWLWGFGLCAGVMGALLAYHLSLLPKVETARQPLSAVGRGLIRPSIVLGLGALIGLVLAGRAFIASAPAQALFEQLQGSAPGLALALSKISVAGWIAIGLFVMMLALLAALPVLHKRMASSDSFYAKAFVSFLAQPQVGRILAFVIFFRAGESFLMKMKYPFLKSIGMSLEQYGVANGTVGMIAALAGPALGGYLISQHGLRRWIWPFVIAQNALNLLYMGLALYSQSAGAPPFWAVTSVIAVEMFGAGLGTAVFMVYLMRCAMPEHRAAHMAILTALMSVGFTLSGVASGFIAEATGFATYFALTCALTVPGMLLIFVVPNIDERE